MSLRTFPPSEMVSRSSVTDERTPLARSISALSSQTSGQFQQSPVHIIQRHLPLPKQSQGGRCVMICILLTVVLERITFYGVLANLLLFLIDSMQFNQSLSIAVVFTFTGLAWLMSTVGGIIADSYSGRYNAVWGSLLIYIVGVGMVFASALLSIRSFNVQNFVYQPLALVALALISIGEGAYKANVTAFGGDQLQAEEDTKYRQFFNWYYWSINVAAFTAYTAIAYVEQLKSFSLGFGILFCCIVLASATFCFSRSRYVCHPPTGHILKKIYNIVKEARQKKKEASTWDSTYQYYPGFEDRMPIKSCLDHAMMKYGGSYLDTDVEEVKTITKIVLIFATLIPYWTIYFQMNSTFLLQGLHMLLPFDRTNPKTGEVKVTVVPAWLSLVDVCFVLVLIPIMDKFVYPWLDRKGWHLNVFTRISIGFLFAIGSMIVAGVVETERRKSDSDICRNQTFPQIRGQVTYVACMPIFYQIPQYGLIGISEVFASVAALEFAYKEAPKTMHSFVMGLFFFVQSAGSLLGGGLFELCSLGKDPWTPSMDKSKTTKDLQGHLAYYFFLLAGILFFTWIVFLILIFGCKLSFAHSNKKRSIHVIRTSSDN